VVSLEAPDEEELIVVEATEAETINVETDNSEPSQESETA
jgi:hypothetical protein